MHFSKFINFKVQEIIETKSVDDEKKCYIFAVILMKETNLY